MPSQRLRCHGGIRLATAAGLLAIAAVTAVMFQLERSDGPAPIATADGFRFDGAGQGDPFQGDYFDQVGSGDQADSGALIGADDSAAPVAAARAVAGIAAPSSMAPAARSSALPDEDRFTVAVAPLSIVSSDPRAIAAFEWAHEAFLEQLRSIPELDLVELEEAPEEALSPDDADFYLTVKAESDLVGDVLWRFRVSWSATRGGSGGWVATGDAIASQSIDDVPLDAAESLRAYPFPPEAAYIVELTARALDTGLDEPARLAAIDELEAIPQRYEFVGRDEQHRVAVAAVEIVASATDPEVRGRVWRSLSNANQNDPYLLAPLIDSLLRDTSDSVRFEAARLLAREFGDDPRSLAAFEYALMHDLSPAVRTQARWQLLDERGRIEYVSATLLNEDLSDMERLELVTAEVHDVPRTIDRRAAMVLADIARRARPSTWDRPSRKHTGEPVSPALVIPLLSDLLLQSDQPNIRSSALSALTRFVDEPGVLETFERALRSEPTDYVRDQLEQVLTRAELGIR